MKPFTRRLFLVGAVLAALAMLMAPGLAGADDDDDDGGGGGGGDRAYCAPPGLPPEPGQCSIAGSFDFDFDASSGPLGENPTGTYHEVAIGRFERVVEITCLQVIGNQAWVGGRITSGTGAGTAFAFTVLDNTPPAADRFLHSFPGVVPEANTPNCGAPLAPLHEVTGDIVVQDNVGGGGDDDDDEDDDDEDDD